MDSLGSGWVIGALLGRGGAVMSNCKILIRKVNWKINIKQE